MFGFVREGSTGGGTRAGRVGEILTGQAREKRTETPTNPMGLGFPFFATIVGADGRAISKM